MKSITRYVRVGITEAQALAFKEAGLSEYEASNEPTFDAGVFAILKNAKGNYELCTGFVIEVPETIAEFESAMPEGSDWLMDTLTAAYATAKTISGKRNLSKIDTAEKLVWEPLAKAVAETTVGVRQRSSGNKAELIANARNVAAAAGISAEQLAALLAALKM